MAGEPDLADVLDLTPGRQDDTGDGVYAGGLEARPARTSSTGVGTRTAASWTSPHGHHYLRDHTGTVLDGDQAQTRPPDRE